MSYLPGEILFCYLAEIQERGQSRTISKTYMPNLDDYDFAHHVQDTVRGYDASYHYDHREGERVTDGKPRDGGEVRGRKVDDVRTGGGDCETPDPTDWEVTPPECDLREECEACE